MRRALLLLLASALPLGCDDGEPRLDGGRPIDAGRALDAGASDAGGSPSEPPTVRDVRVDLTGVTELTIDLGATSEELVLPEPTATEWIVQVSDDLTAAEALDVTVVTVDDAPLAGQSASFERGNWRITATARPGDALTVRAIDEDGNVTTHAPTLRIPSLTEALVGAWERREHGLDQSIAGRADVSLLDDGTWTSMGPAAGQTRGGAFEVTDGQLLFERRVASGGDTDPSTVERAETGPFFVDARFLSRAPWRRTDASSGAEGSFERGWARTEAGASATVTETLALGASGAYEWRRALDGAASGSEEGTFAVELTENYEDSLGDFLRITVTRRDGMDLTAPEDRLEMFIDLGDRLLVGPLIRTP